jgi:hypothetical protein
MDRSGTETGTIKMQDHIKVCVRVLKHTYTGGNHDAEKQNGKPGPGEGHCLDYDKTGAAGWRGESAQDANHKMQIPNRIINPTYIATVVCEE